MNPVKVYPHNNYQDKKKLLELFTKEKSILGSDTDKFGKYYIIVDGDCSELLKAKKGKEMKE